MADELKRVGLVFKADGTTDFAKSLTQINALTKENYNSFKLAQSQYDKNTSSVSKLTDTQKYLSQNTELYKNKVAVLEEELKERISAIPSMGVKNFYNQELERLENIRKEQEAQEQESGFKM